MALVSGSCWDKLFDQNQTKNDLIVLKISAANNESFKSNYDLAETGTIVKTKAKKKPEIVLEIETNAEQSDVGEGKIQTDEQSTIISPEAETTQGNF